LKINEFEGKWQNLTYFRIEADIKVNDAFVLKEMEKMGLFIIASNDISLSPEEMLKYYKGQDRVEKGFRFLKCDTLSVHVQRPSAVNLI